MTGSLSITACLIVRNEAEHLERCLSGLAGQVDTIRITDTGSTDGTLDVARKFGAVIGSFPWCDDFAAARNASIRGVSEDWILCLDADDAFPPGQVSRLQELLAPDAMAATVLYHVRPDYTPAQSLKLLRNDPELRFEGIIHENVRRWIRSRAGDGRRVQHLPLRLMHHGYSSEMLPAKVERNLMLLGKEWEVCQSGRDLDQRFYIAAELGLMRFFSGEKQGAVSQLEAALAELLVEGQAFGLPAAWPVVTNLCWCLKQTGDSERGLSIFREVERLFAELPAYQLGRGVAEMEGGFHAAALGWLERFQCSWNAGAHDLPVPVEYVGAGLWRAMGACCMGIGEHARAVRCFERCVELEPQNREHGLRLLVATRMMQS